MELINNLKDKLLGHISPKKEITLEEALNRLKMNKRDLAIIRKINREGIESLLPDTPHKAPSLSEEDESRDEIKNITFRKFIRLSYNYYRKVFKKKFGASYNKKSISEIQVELVTLVTHRSPTKVELQQNLYRIVTLVFLINKKLK